MPRSDWLGWHAELAEVGSGKGRAITIAGIELLQRIWKGQFGLGGLEFKAELHLLSGTRCWELKSVQRSNEFLLVSPICTRATELDVGYRLLLPPDQ
jgi:hypothetical protein